MIKLLSSRNDITLSISKASNLRIDTLSLNFLTLLLIFHQKSNFNLIFSKSYCTISHMWNLEEDKNIGDVNQNIIWMPQDIHISKLTPI